MIVTGYEIVPCVQRQEDENWTFARAKVSELRGWILVLRDGEGVTGLGYAHAIPAITTDSQGARAALEFMRPHVIGRDALDIAAVMDGIERALAFNWSAKAAVDMAMHDLASRRLGIGLSHLLGGPRRSSIPQARIVPIKSPEAMAGIAGKLAEEGYRAVKLKLDGDVETDIARIREVRAAVGPTVAITLDPNQSYRAKAMIRAFSRMEPYDIRLIEQPVPAADWEGLALVSRALPVAVEADESVVTVADVMRVVRERTADVVNLKITKLGGIRNMLTAVALCESAGISPRMGAAFGPGLLQAASAHVASTFRSLDHACELSEHLHLLDDPFTPVPVVAGDLPLPEGTGCGVELAAGQAALR